MEVLFGSAAPQLEGADSLAPAGCTDAKGALQRPACCGQARGRPRGGGAAHACHAPDPSAEEDGLSRHSGRRDKSMCCLCRLRRIK